MLVENSFPADTRVRNEASTLVSNGYRVSVIALRGARRTAPGGRGRRDGLSAPRLTVFEQAPDGKPTGSEAACTSCRWSSAT